jgi:hypothetical protein
MYSGHDDQISNVLTFLKKDDIYYTVPYASTVYFELHYDEECIASIKDESCFSVYVEHNGVELNFD